MLNLFITAATFASLCAICIFFVRAFNIPSGATPFIVICGVIVSFSLLGCLGLLSVAVWLFYLLAFAAIVYCVVTRKKPVSERVLTPSFILFLFCSVSLIILLFTRKPLFVEWDEFSLWGTAAKITAETNMLYPSVQTGFPWAVSQKPALIMISYLFNSLGSFEPWRMYFAYDIMMLSAFSVACAVFSAKKWNLCVPLYISCLILPFINVYTRNIYLTTPYLNAYADIPMGILMGGIFALYFFVCRTKSKGLLLLPAFCLGALTLCKDTGLPLALLCAAIISADIIFLQKNSEFVLHKRLRGIWAKLLVCFSYFFACGTCFIIWSKYLDSLGLASNALGGEGNMTPVQLVLNGLLLLFGLTPTTIGAPFTEKFALVFSNMIHKFFYSRITLLGTGLTVIGVVITLLVIAYFISADKALRRRIALFGATGILGFIPYYAFIGFTYVFVFKGDSGIGLIDYNRYVACYYVALIIGTLALFAHSICSETRRTSIKQGIIMYASGLALPAISLFLLTSATGRKMPIDTDLYVPVGLFILISIAAFYGTSKSPSALLSIALSLMSIFIFSTYVPSHLCIINAPDAVYSEQDLLEKNANKIKDVLGKGKAFFHSSLDAEGACWFKHHYVFYPAIIDYSWGGGDMHDCAALNDSVEDVTHLNVSLGQLAANLYESDNDFFIIHDSNYSFAQSYGSLFSSEIKNGIYKIEKKMGAVITDNAPLGTQLARASNSIVVQETVRVMQNPEEYIKLTLIKEGFYE